MPKSDATIFALATGAPPTAIAIIRIAGPRANATLAAMIGGPLPPPRRLTWRRLIDPGDGSDLDDALVVVFPAPASVTGDDVVELHLHGGVAVVAAVLAALDRAGLVAAGPGAFTRRAFDNGKLDIGRVEALGDLIAAETDEQRRAALARTGAGLGNRVAAWRLTLLRIRGDIEASLDFADDDGIPTEMMDDARQTLAALRTDLVTAIADGGRAGRLRDGVAVALVGPVNAGKSTLFNALVRRDAAMVSPHPGTTRDMIEVRTVIEGVPVTLIDTAGLRMAGDELEAEGIRRGARRAAAADLVIAVGGEATNAAAIRVRSKSDLDSRGAGWRDGILHLSAATGEGLDLLERDLALRVRQLTAASEAPLVAHRWQAMAMADGIDAIDASLRATDLTIVAEEVRRAADALDRVVGRIATDDVLDIVFARFCIGK